VEIVWQLVSSVAMRQLTFLSPGRLEWREVPDARIEASDDALVRPVAATTCDLDQMVLRGEAPFSGPLALGHECVAEIIELGGGVGGGLSVGQLVAVPWHVSCWSCERCRRGVPTSCRETPHAMYGLPVGGEWGSMFSDLLRVPHAEGALVVLPPGVAPADAASVSDNLPAAWEVTVPHLADYPEAQVLIMGGCGSIALYAVACAVAAAASRIDYLDNDPVRLELAQRLGANAIEGSPPRKVDGEYLITVDASAHDPDALACALRSVAPEGRVSTIGVYFQDVTIPIFEMYLAGVRFHAGKSNARPVMPAVLDLLSAGRVQPGLIATEVLAWDEMPQALADPSMKPVFVRDPATS
jgi:threonine dehydrogenase-like Zn-dependent dehydrogenase